MTDPAPFPLPNQPLPFEADLAPIFSGFVRIAAHAAKSAQPGVKDIAFQRILEGLIRSWREEARFMRRMRAFGPHPLAAAPSETTPASN